MRRSQTLHGGLVATRIEGLWRGVLVVGPPGSGKSDLALRATSAGWRLVADDRTVVFASQGRAFGRAPPAIRDLAEIRGVGIVRAASVPIAEIVLVVRCAADPAGVERLPEPERTMVAGVAIPAIDLWPFEESAPAKLLHAARHLGAHRQQAYQAALPRRRCADGGFEGTGLRQSG